MSTEHTSTFELKGGLYTLTALQLFGLDLSAFEQQLTHKIAQAPQFFAHAPVIIDIHKLPTETPLDFHQLRDILIRKQLIPVGVKGGHATQQAAAVKVGLAVLPDSSKEIFTPVVAADTTVPVHGSNTRIIKSPVRSGQQIYARGGDLIVIGPVSQGAELLADGHIHVYGPLRGRALAGITGDETAHIFCQSLEAELISIAGHYKISEDIEHMAWRVAVDVFLDNGRLHVEPF